MEEEKTVADAQSADFINDLQSAMAANPELRAALEEIRNERFANAVAESRKNHIAFVQKYMGDNYAVKFADALAGETYFVSFFRTKKTANVSIPPMEMSGAKIEQLKPGRMYACNGYEARMLERVLASKRIEVLNLTPRKDQYLVEFNEAMRNWGRLFPHPNNQKKKGFSNYREDVQTSADPNEGAS